MSPEMVGILGIIAMVLLLFLRVPVAVAMIGVGLVGFAMIINWTAALGRLGSDTFFHIHETGLAETITVRADGEVGFRHGDRVHLTPREDSIHRFDAEGLRL